MNLSKIKKVHFIGIGGIGVSAVAKMFLKLKKQVTGSDICQSEITNKLKTQGAKVMIGHQQNNLDQKTDLVIYSAAVSPDNPELKKAKELQITEMSYSEFLGQLSLIKKTIAVTGTNGKTTTSAILGKVLVDSGFDPTVIIGSQLKEFDGNLHLGQSAYLALEADEYKASMLNLKPWSILLTSIEEDHLDFYKDIKDIIYHFQQFIDKLPSAGYLFYNADDENISKLKLPKNSFGCSLKQETDYWAEDLKIFQGGYQFSVYTSNESLGEFNLRIPGEYNVLNSLMVIGLCHKMKVNLENIKKSLADFGGLWRRFEVLGNLKNINNVLVVSDYTHHPAAIKKTLKAARDFYPKSRLFLVYQPHQHNRTRKLFNQFVPCFNQADFIILNEIYEVAGRKYTEDVKISSQNLVDEIIKTKYKTAAEIIYSANLKNTKDLIYQFIRPNDLLLIIGAGDIDNLARQLI